ncbi:unnamed protein product [Brassica oleracea]
MDQKTIEDRVNSLLEENNSLSKASPVVRTHQKSVNSPALVAATPGPKNNLAKTVDKATDMRPLDFLVISPAKATKDDKANKDDKGAKDPAYGRGCRRQRIVKGEEADEKKKAAQADAAFKRKEKAEAKKKEAEAKKKEAEAKKKVAEAKKKEAELKKKQEAELKKQNQAGSKYKKVTPPRDGVRRCKVQPDVEDSSLADITDEVVAEQNEFAPESDVENSEVVRSAIIKEYREKSVRLTPKGLSMTAVSSSLKLMQHIKAIPPKPPAPPGKKEVLIADHESDFYSILIHERFYDDCSWLFDDVKEQCQCDTKLCKS